MERKNIRLPMQNYVGQRTYFLTLCCDRRRPAFRSPTLARWIIDNLHKQVSGDFAILAYCVMPDHVHIVLNGLNHTSDFLRFVKAFKQRTGFHYHKKHRHRLWQPKFYDHILRPKDTLDSVLWYVWWNPVRKNLCTAPGLYPFSGPFTAEWNADNQP